MKYLHTIIWILFAAVIGFYAWQYIYISTEHHCLNIIRLEIANAANGKALLQDWYQQKIGSKTLLHYAQTNTIADFVFIVAYTGILIIVSYAIMQREPNPVLNNLLRLNMLLAVLVGVLDVCEDIILLYDMYNYYPQKYFVSSQVFAYSKFFVAIYIIAIWLFSLAGRQSRLRGKKSLKDFQ